MWTQTFVERHSMWILTGTTFLPNNNWRENETILHFESWKLQSIKPDEISLEMRSGQQMGLRRSGYY
jgi:hypothetical protein